jgi:hypothetical protein
MSTFPNKSASRWVLLQSLNNTPYVNNLFGYHDVISRIQVKQSCNNCPISTEILPFILLVRQLAGESALMGPFLYEPLRLTTAFETS